MKNWVWVVIIVVVVIGAVGYLGRHKIKAMLGMSQPAPVIMHTITSNKTSSALVPSNNIYLVKTSKIKGQYLTDIAGNTLYTFDKDVTGVSNCIGQCLAIWPVYISGAASEKTLPANISVISRKDGAKQFAWKGRPLYYYVQDKKPGEINGDGVGGVWHIVKP